jgi:peptidoglycan/LPS O-acetylase OafA/YrhL
MKATVRFNGLDHLRALAIIAVFFYHYGGGIFGHHPAWLANVCQFGWSGVDLFFVLSGYLIGGQLLRMVAEGRRVSIRDFYVQRFLRIMPVYWAVLSLYFIFPQLIERSHLPPLWRFLTFTQNFGLGEGEGLAFSQVWSLCIEEHFYLVLPTLIVGFSAWKWRRHWLWLAGLLIALGCALRAYFWLLIQAGQARWYGAIYYPTYSHLDGLVVGVSIAAIFTFYPEHRARLQKHSYWVLAGGVTLLYFASVVIDANQTSFASSVFGFPLVAVGFGCLVISALSPNCFLYSLDSPVTRMIATLSYSVYLIHKIVISVVQRAAETLQIDVDGTLTFLLCILCSFFAAWVLYTVVERPFLRLRERIYSAGKVKSTPVNPATT